MAKTHSHLRICRSRGDRSLCVPVRAFGEDHWSLLAYVDDCCLGQSGRVEHHHMRCNPAKLNGSAWWPRPGTPWQSEQGTRLKGYREAVQPELQLPDHDDWDCLRDLEAAGFIYLVYYATGLVHITPVGLKAAAALRAHAARGDRLDSFSYG